MAEPALNKKNMAVIIGVMIMCVGMMVANFGCAVSMASAMGAMDADRYYVLVSALGSLGMVLVLPIVGQLTGIIGQRNLIVLGIAVQLAGRVVMMLVSSWVPYALGFLLQAIGNGFYVSSVFVIISMNVSPQGTPKYFGYIAVANAVGSILGPILVSTMTAMGATMGKLAYIVNFPITIIGFALVFKSCPNQKIPNAGKGFDYLGLVLSVVGLSCLVLWMNLGDKMFTWLSAPSAILVVAAVATLAWVIRRELSIANPAIPLKMFKNRRLTYSFIGMFCSSVYSTCVAAYTVMWTMYNFSAFPGYALFNGTASLANHVVGLILGLFLGGYIGQKFVKRFRPFAIASSVSAIIATGLLFCLRFTGTAAAGNVMAIGNIPVGMILIYVACAIGGFNYTVANSTLNVYWQTNTPPEEMPSGMAMASFAALFASCFFGALAGVLMGNSGDYTIAFGAACVICIIGLFFAIVGFKFTPEEIAAAEAQETAQP